MRKKGLKSHIEAKKYKIWNNIYINRRKLVKKKDMERHSISRRVLFLEGIKIECPIKTADDSQANHYKPAKNAINEVFVFDSANYIISVGD